MSTTDERPDPSPSTADVAAWDARTLAEHLADGRLTAKAAVTTLLRRIAEIDHSGPSLRSVLSVAPDAVETAEALDAERAAGHVRGPLHGVPVLVKDNIDTVGAMGTTAGSLALVDSQPAGDATVVRRLRDAGAVILGKTNLSEWANFRSTSSTSGWSAVGGLCVNPYALDRSAGGSSSGSAAAVAAGLAPLAVGTETDGSIVCPAALCGVVGLKPTVGLVSTNGVIPIAKSQDTPGPIARTVWDAAALLNVLAEPSASRPRDYTAYCRDDGLRGARIGVPRRILWGYCDAADAAAEEAVRLLAASGATIVDPADLPGIEELSRSDAEITVLSTEFKVYLDAYLATRTPGSPRTLADLVAFNEAHAEQELRYFGQDRFEAALRTRGLDDPDYRAALEACRLLGRERGIDAALAAHELDALVAPAYPPAWPIDLTKGDLIAGGCSQPAAVAGYPLLTVPCGLVDGLPVGLAFMGTAWSEPTLIRLGHAFERALDLTLWPTYRSAG
ncbi:amidase [Thermasporomyces composti]|uniref:Amidase n=1 Tax=Thermasporomyces composti TaxID=696763 RepID=A0A3D9V5H5_THECX|nr:amidase [Thermasporomyces composti]REF35953.1 amidase [Thermasporomyces composti]